MRNKLLAFSLIVAAAIATTALTPTEASPLRDPSALLGAADDISIRDNVHCRPGWRHHRPNRWRRANGCLRPGVIIVPGVGYRFRHGFRRGPGRVIIRPGMRGGRVIVRPGMRGTGRVIIRPGLGGMRGMGGMGGMRGMGGMGGGMGMGMGR